MSREALSLEISTLVSRVVKGETIDIPQTGAALAAKYPDLGMSGALIGQAIERAAGMVGMIRSTPVPTKRMPLTAGKVMTPGSEPPASNGHAFTETRTEETRPLHPPEQPAIEATVAVTAPTAPSFDDELAAAIDAEIGDLVSGRARPRTTDGQETGTGHPSVTGNDTAPSPAVLAKAARESKPAKRGSGYSSIFSGFRRVLFRG